MWRWQQIAQVLKDPRRGAEIGVKEGRFTSHMLGQFPRLTMYAVDRWAPKDVVLDRKGYEDYQDWDFAGIRAEFDRVTAPFGSRCVPLVMDSSAAAAEIEDGSLDFVFIDAEHTYEGVYQDIAEWRPKLRPGGLLSGHDYNGKRFPGVRRAVDEVFDRVSTGHDLTWWVTV